MKPLSPCALPFAVALFAMAVSPRFTSSAGKDESPAKTIEAAHGDVKTMLSARAQARHKNEALLDACADKKTEKETVAKLLESGADPNARENLSGYSALDHAVEQGRADIVELLLGHKANPNVLDSWGGSPLSGAAAAGNMKIVKLLLEHKANPRLVGPQRKYKDNITTPDTPYCWAVKNKHLDIAKLLRERLGKDADLECPK